MLKNLLYKCLITLSLSSTGQSFQATYGFANVDPSTGTADPGPFPQVSGLQFGAFSTSGVSSSPNASGRFAFTNWPLGAINGDDHFENFVGSLSPFSFYTFTIRVNPGYTLSIENIEFSVRRSGTGPRNYALRSNLDNYTSNLSASTGTNSKLSIIPTDVFFWNYDSISTSYDQYGNSVNLGFSPQAITDSIQFHIYAWNAESSGGSFSVDNVKIRGSVLDSLQITATQSEAHLSADLRVYPNPLNGKVFFIEGLFQGSVELFDSFGRPVSCDLIEHGKGRVEVRIGASASAALSLRLKTQNRIVCKRILRE